MGLSKKKFKKKITMSESEAVEMTKAKAKKTGSPAKEVVSTENLFSEVKDVANLKKRREKLKADRFKEEKAAHTSKTEEVLLKKMIRKQENRETMGLEPNPKRAKPSMKKHTEDDFGGELEDLWDTPAPVKSKMMNEYKQGYAKQERINVKQVILPKGGHSYNPNQSDHLNLLKSTAKKEEEIAKKELDALRVIRPSLFEDDEPREAASEGSQESSSEEEDSSDVEEEEKKPFSINEPVDRTKAKTQTQRNKDKLAKWKVQQQKEALAAKKFGKDIDRIENLMKQATNEAKAESRVIERRHKEVADEIKRQEKVGVIGKAKNLGRFKYKQRKEDFQMEDDLAPDLRRMKPLGNDQLMQDRFDSIFRQNKVECDAPTNAEKRKYKKREYKLVNKMGTKAKEMHSEIQDLQKKNKEAKLRMSKSAQKQMANQDVIII